jgi:lipoyl synthase
MSSISGRKKPLIFAVPGSKVYIGDSWTNTRSSFLNISITGSSCELQCRHCRGQLLKHMIAAAGSSTLISITEKYMQKSVLKGMLISGGFDSRGILDFSPLAEGMEEIKKRYPQLTIYVHAGFLDGRQALMLKQTGVDAVLVNLINSQKAIEEVYNLKGRTYRDYLDSIKVLKEHDLKVAPHIIAGLEKGKLSGEFRAVEDAVRLGADSIVFAVLKKASPGIDFPASAIPDEAIIRLVGHARRLSADIGLSFGCARPPARDRHLLEIGLIKAGIDSIAFPSEKTVRYAVENKIAHTFVEKCCANL